MAPTKGAPAPVAQAPVAQAVQAPAVQPLTNNTTTNNTTAGALCSTFGVVVASPGGNVTTCRSKGAQWPNLGGTPSLHVYPCQLGTGAAALGTPHNGGTKLWAYQPGAVRVALCPKGMAALRTMATAKGAPPSLLGLLHLCTGG